MLLIPKVNLDDPNELTNRREARAVQRAQEQEDEDELEKCKNPDRLTGRKHEAYDQQSYAVSRPQYAREQQRSLETNYGEPL